MLDNISHNPIKILISRIAAASGPEPCRAEAKNNGGVLIAADCFKKQSPPRDNAQPVHQADQTGSGPVSIQLLPCCRI